MQRIAERDDATNAESGRVIGRGKMRRDAAAHRLAADEHVRPTEMLARRCDCGAIAGLQLLGPIRNTSCVLRVQEVERQHIDAALGETTRKADDEGALLRRTRPVREYERRIRSDRRRICKRRRRVARDGYGDLRDAASCRSCILTAFDVFEEEPCF
jgi:hypothetical protein